MYEARGHYLKIPCLGDEPVVDEFLRLLRKTQEEVTIDLQLVNSFHCVVDLQMKNHILQVTTVQSINQSI